LSGDRSIYRISGQATVNGKDATLQTTIKPGDTLKTAKNSEMIFVVNSHAMIMRSNSHLVIEAGQAKPEKIEGAKAAEKKAPVETRITEESSMSSFISGLEMLSGKLLSVSRNSPMKVRTATATIGIRGTGFYVEADPEQTYFCTCYGTTDITSNENPENKTTVISQHHERPLYILKAQSSGHNIRNAPFVDHTDQELTLIEALVGRTPEFVFANDTYSAPRRDY